MLLREPRPKRLIRHSSLSSQCLMKLIPIIWIASSPTPCNNLCRNSFSDRTTSRFLCSSHLEVRNKPRMARQASCNVILPKWWPQTNTMSRKTTSSRSPMRLWSSSPFSCNTTNSMAYNRTISTQMASSWTISTVLEVATQWINSRWLSTSLKDHLRMLSSNRPC